MHISLSICLQRIKLIQQPLNEIIACTFLCAQLRFGNTLFSEFNLNVNQLQRIKLIQRPLNEMVACPFYVPNCNLATHCLANLI